MTAADFPMLRTDDVLRLLETDGYAIGQVDPTEYHAMKGVLSKKTGLHVVSKSSLAEFRDSPYKYHYNVENGVKKESSGFFMGSLVDTLLLTPELYETQYRVVAVDLRTKEGKAAKAETEAAGQTIIKPDELAQGKATAAKMEEVLREYGLVRGETFLSQVGMWVRLEEVGGVRLDAPLILTGMLDICPLAGDTLWDAKTTSKAARDEQQLFYACADYHYGTQGVIYSDLFAMCTGEERTFKFLFGETQMPPEARVVSMSESTLDFYRSRYEQALIRLAHCVATDDWGNGVHEEVEFTPQRKELWAAD